MQQFTETLSLFPYFTFTLFDFLNQLAKGVCMCMCCCVSHHNPQAGQAVYAGVFDSCSYDAAAIEPVSPGSAVRPVGRWPQPH